MLYITFQVKNHDKLKDFEKLYQYMIEARQPSFQRLDDYANVDWGDLSDEEMSELFNDDLQSKKVFEGLFPDYTTPLLHKHFNHENEKLGPIGLLDMYTLLDYIESGFEVDMDELKVEGDKGIVKFSTGNYPFGGLDRLILILNAFELSPQECFNGFEVFAFKWISELEYKTIELPDITDTYLNTFKK